MVVFSASAVLWHGAENCTLTIAEAAGFQGRESRLFWNQGLLISGNEVLTPGPQHRHDGSLKASSNLTGQ